MFNGEFTFRYVTTAPGYKTRPPDAGEPLGPCEFLLLYISVLQMYLKDDIVRNIGDRPSICVAKQQTVNSRQLSNNV